MNATQWFVKGVHRLAGRSILSMTMLTPTAYTVKRARLLIS